MMCISLFSYGRPVVVRCMGGSVGYGLGWVSYLVGLVGSMKIDPRTTLLCPSFHDRHRPKLTITLHSRDVG